MYVIGIAGGSCSGKTTLTSKLSEALTDKGYRTEALHADKFFIEPIPKATAPFTGIEYDDYDHPGSYKLREFCGAIDNTQNADIIIADGLLTLYFDAVREKLDLKIFVDLRDDERLARRIKRFQRNKKLPLDEIANRYLDIVRYRHDEFVEPSRQYADMVINGTLDNHNGIEILLKYIESKVKLNK